MRKTYKTLLLSFLCLCTCQAEPCVDGRIRESVFLPCHYNGTEDLMSLNISLEWRRGAEMVYKAVWREGHEERHNMNINERTTVSSLAQTGNFTMALSNLSFSDAQNYSLHLKLHDKGANVLMCTVCLNIAGDLPSPVYTSAIKWILSLALCVLVAVLVAIALCFQKKWDREAKREHEDDSDCEDTEMIMMGTEY